MTTINELKQAITENKILIWNDPDYIEGGDYTINFIEDIDWEIFDEDTPILIQYGKRSEAEVYLNEIVEADEMKKLFETDYVIYDKANDSPLQDSYGRVLLFGNKLEADDDCRGNGKAN